MSSIRSCLAPNICKERVSLLARHLEKRVVPILLLLGPGALVRAQDDSESGYDRLWANTRLYEGGEDSAFQFFDLSGRLQIDLAFTENGNMERTEFNVRRFRFGFKTGFLDNFVLHLEAAFNPQEADPAYSKLTDAYLTWKPRRAFNITAGKHSAGFTMGGLTSSKRLLTIDRNNLTQNIWFTEEYIPGISIRGKVKGLSYFVGEFSSGDDDGEFGDFAAGEFTLFRVAHDFADALGVEEAHLKFGYVDNHPDPDNSFTQNLYRIFSFNWVFETQRWGMGVDLSTGQGYAERSDLWGLVVMPFYKLSKA